MTRSGWPPANVVVMGAATVTTTGKFMRGNHQNVQRIVNDLVGEKLLAFQANPHHRRAQQLVVLTEASKRVLDAAKRLQAPRINELSDELRAVDIETTHQVITAL